MTSTSLKEVEDGMKRVQERYTDCPGPELFFVDNCCQARDQLKTCFPSLDEGTAPVEQLPLLSFGGNVIVADTVELVDYCVHEFAEYKVLGLDIEWNVSFKTGEARGKVALMQIRKAKWCSFVFASSVTSLRR